MSRGKRDLRREIHKKRKLILGEVHPPFKKKENFSGNHLRRG